MGKLINRQNLTQEQYKRANRIMSSVLIMCYIVYIIVEIMNIGKFENGTEEAIEIDFWKSSLRPGDIIVENYGGDPKMYMEIQGPRRAETILK